LQDFFESKYEDDTIISDNNSTVVWTSDEGMVRLLSETEFVSFKAYRIEDNYYVFLLIDEEELRVLIEECEVQGIE
jgi:hypothetical protein